MIELPKGDWDHKGTWHPSIARPALGPPIVNAIICCPTCGRDAALSRHSIAADGTVTPSCVCPEGCGFHDHVKLVDWDPNAA
jgi:hypothetical protein